MKSFLFFTVFFLFSFSLSIPLLSQETDYTVLQEKLAQAVEDNAKIGSEIIISSFVSVPRHIFLPENRITTAYEDRTIPLGRGRFIPSPSDIGSLLAFSGIKEDDRVLILGYSSGYTSALAYRITENVTIIEMDTKNVPAIESYFSGIGDNNDSDEIYAPANVEIRGFEDLYTLSVSEPFSLILIQAGVDEVPPVLFSLLEPGGKIAGALKGESGFSILFRFDMNNGGGRITTGKEVYLPFLEKWP